MTVEQILENDERKFLVQSIKLSKTLDNYKSVLGLDTDEVANFKNEVELFLYIVQRYHSFSESFIIYNMDSMRQRLSDMVNHCMQSKNYTAAIGEALGIEVSRPVLPFIGHLGFLIGIQK